MRRLAETCRCFSPRLRPISLRYVLKLLHKYLKRYASYAMQSVEYTYVLSLNQYWISDALRRAKNKPLHVLLSCSKREEHFGRV